MGDLLVLRQDGHASPVHGDLVQAGPPFEVVVLEDFLKS